jgi:hypothetical protein
VVEATPGICRTVSPGVRSLVAGVVVLGLSTVLAGCSASGGMGVGSATSTSADAADAPTPSTAPSLVKTVSWNGISLTIPGYFGLVQVGADPGFAAEILSMTHSTEDVEQHCIYTDPIDGTSLALGNLSLLSYVTDWRPWEGGPRGVVIDMEGPIRAGLSSACPKQ